MEEKLRIIRDILGGYRQSSNEFLFQCPFCGHHKKKMSVNFAINAFKCWVCDTRGKNIYRLVRKFGTYQQKQKWLELDGRLDLSEFDKMFMEMNDEEVKQVVELPQGFTSLCNKRLPKSSKRPLSYLNSRGITKKDILMWKMGYCTEGRYSGRIIVPSFNNDGNCNYFIARSFVGHNRKYLNPPISKNIVFNELYVDWDEPVILVEGLFDALVAGQNAIPILGSTLREESKLFQAIVINDSPVYLALDEDAKNKEEYIIKLFHKYDVSVKTIDTTNIEDVGSMSKSQFLARMSKAVEPDIDEINFLNQLRNI
jgi:DNA primase|tara:strand:+ start:1957 stop:2892 length:936 start_codon:yes stop_codon:yes gene_type:complete